MSATQPRTVGILGAGQLGAMLGKAIQKLGITPLFYDENPEAPALVQFPNGTVGSWTDSSALAIFFSRCDVVTFEFENVNLVAIEPLVREMQLPIHPPLDVMRTAQDRLLEKTFLAKNGIPVTPFASDEQLRQDPSLLGFPLIAKTTTLGYDGKGQWRINNRAELAELLNKNPGPLVAEEPILLETEASVIVCRDSKGNCCAFPVFENLHENHILAYTLLPARLSNAVAQTLQGISCEIAEKLGATALLTVEFFLSRHPPRNATAPSIDGLYLFVNELAPRPHNSGHITLSACNLSQFDAHARILCGLPLTTPRLRPGGWCMGNLLGDLWPAPEAPLKLDSLAEHPAVSDVVLYGKGEAKHGRKMGHFTAEQPTPHGALAAAQGFHQSLLCDNQKKHLI